MSYAAIALEEQLGGVAELTDTTASGSRISDDVVYPAATEVQLALAPSHLDRGDENRGITADPPMLINGYEPAGRIASRLYPNLLAMLLPPAGFTVAIDEGDGTLDVKTLSITGSPTGGTFRLTFDGELSSPIAYNATAAQVQAALEGMSKFRPGGFDVEASGGPLPTDVTLTFKGRYACQAVASITTTDALTGGTSPASAVADTTPGTTGTVLDPDGNGLQADTFRIVATKRATALAKTMEVWAAYTEQGVYLRGNGFGVSGLTFDHEGTLGADLAGLFVRAVPDPGLTPAADSVAIRPLRRGDLTLTWLGGSAQADEFSVSIENALERADHIGAASYFPKILEHTGKYPRMTGSINKRQLDEDDYAALLDARTFAATARFIGESHIGSTGTPYALWVEMPACQYTGGDPSPITNARRFPASFQWAAAYDESEATDFTITMVCAMERVESYS